MSPAALTVGAAVLTGAFTALAAGPVLNRLPEPSEPGDKIAYRSLVTRSFVAACGVVSLLASAVAWLCLPLPVQPAWTVLGTAGLLLAAVDLRTTWLPLRLTHATWLLMGVALGLKTALHPDLDALLRSGIGAALAGGLYGTVWLVSRGGFGFGDVRFAPLIGAATGLVSWPLLLWALLLGTVIGVVFGVARQVAHRRGPFPYAPAMLAGAYAAAGVLAL